MAGGGTQNLRPRHTRARGDATRTHHRVPPTPTSFEQQNKPQHSDLLLQSTALPLVLGSLFNFGAVPRPSGLGVRDFNGTKSLGLCPPTPNCVSTAEEANDIKHYIPQWTYGKTKTPAEAMQDLVDACSQAKVENFTPAIITRDDGAGYLYAEFTSDLFGFIDDVEFLINPATKEVEYRSASRVGESDGDANRKRIRAIRKFLEPRGWKSIGFQ
jgi:uncharacterized protein (DUF1499 family)